MVCFERLVCSAVVFFMAVELEQVLSCFTMFEILLFCYGIGLFLLQEVAAEKSVAWRMLLRLCRICRRSMLLC